jgi:hypothetical protein
VSRQPNEDQPPASRTGVAREPGRNLGRDRAPEDPVDENLRLLRRNQGRWKLSFSLFLLGFMLLIVVARKNPPAAEAWALRGTAAALCVGAFFLARQARRNPHA